MRLHNGRWKCFAYLPTSSCHSSRKTFQLFPNHTPAAVGKISIKTNCNKFYNTWTFCLSDFSAIIKCVIKCSWDVWDMRSPCLLLMENIYYCLCLRMMSGEDLLLFCFFWIFDIDGKFMVFLFFTARGKRRWYANKESQILLSLVRILMMTRFIYVCLKKFNFAPINFYFCFPSPPPEEETSP